MSAVTGVSTSSGAYPTYMEDDETNDVVVDVSPAVSAEEQPWNQEDRQQDVQNADLEESSSAPDGWTQDQIDQFKQNEKQQINSTISQTNKSVSDGNDKLEEALSAEN